MLLIVQIAVGVILGILLTKWLSTLPHKMRVKRLTRTLLVLSNNDLTRLVLEGYEQIFSMPNRDWLTELSFCEDPARDVTSRFESQTIRQIGGQELLRAKVRGCRPSLRAMIASNLISSDIRFTTWRRR